ncbi:MAG: hypothetical protein RL737_1678 [Bacteroidota bacterium]|jgi:hypothetical protein
MADISNSTKIITLDSHCDIENLDKNMVRKDNRDYCLMIFCWNKKGRLDLPFLKCIIVSMRTSLEWSFAIEQGFHSF